MRASQALLIAAGLAGGVLGTSLAGPHAGEIIRAQGPFGAPPYDDPNAVLGAPATWFYDPLGGFMGGTTNRRVKLVEAAFNVAPDTNGLITPKLIVTLGAGSEVIVRFDRPVYDQPANPYGLDLLVFGNSFYTPTTFVNDGTDLNTCGLTGGLYAEPVMVSVSPGYTGQPGEMPDDPDTWPWYRYDDGPYGDTDFPTQAFRWDRATAQWTEDLMDFTKPVNPAMKNILRAGGLSAADAIELYAGSGGGTGFDLRESGFPWIQFVKVEGLDPGFSDGEIDAFAIVRSMLVGDTLSIAPENVASNIATLFFQWPGAADETALTLQFHSISTVAQVVTAPLDDFAPYAPLPGVVLNAVQLGLSTIFGAGDVMFETDFKLSVGEAYAGDGGDLLVLKANGTNWNHPPFDFNVTNRQVLVSGVTNLSAFVVVRLIGPMLKPASDTPGFAVTFNPLTGLTHTLERSTNLIHWSPLQTFTATNAQPVSFTDETTQGERAFYRVRVQRP